MAILKISFLFILLIGFSAVYAQDSALDKIYLEIITEYEKISTFQADFTQKNYWAEPDISQESTGKIIYNSDKLLLSYSDPEGQKMILDSTFVTLYDPNSNQVMITAKAEQNIKPIELIKQYWNNSEKKFLENENGFNKIVLKTDDGQKIILQIKKNLIFFLELSDFENNSVSYYFKNIVTNIAIPDSIFIFEILEDANVIDTRE
ncbi:MAG: outer-membrane lipoprotein carrier protein LolA [Candidatus Cloacimonetes bacterium]|nr:outer-membrane lipoprotein carrier protein LolA [Candidatus Cloacimonadota bacterium]